MVVVRCVYTEAHSTSKFVTELGPKMAKFCQKWPSFDPNWPSWGLMGSSWGLKWPTWGWKIANLRLTRSIAISCVLCEHRPMDQPAYKAACRVMCTRLKMDKLGPKFVKLRPKRAKLGPTFVIFCFSSCWNESWSHQNTLIQSDFFSPTLFKSRMGIKYI